MKLETKYNVGYEFWVPRVFNKRHKESTIVDGKEYMLTINDCLKLQGYSPEFKLNGNNKDQWNQVGNTIPTIFTEIIGHNIKKYYN